MRYLMILAALAAAPFAQAADEAALTAEARQQAKSLGQSLMKTLKHGIELSGPEAAIDLCNTEAPVIAGQLSEGDWQVGRTSLKVRNPENTPDVWEEQTLHEFEQRLQAGEDPMKIEATRLTENEFRYMKAIPTGGLCVTCHGAELSEPVKARLAQLYPEDQARGFSVGDLRGAFTLTKTLQ
ncbi:MAG: glutamate synthase [Oceanospirillaceae bacterium]|nr:glutamate synthase [Oceanospirillaceae bacterium]MBT12328.1 glutamate synthase [Oceanospirillaceae bacterium]|tara:strand:+ start:27711 stop:28256 length:546 start_codon:yes stop_codon:yes gene_type:complete